MAEEFDIEETTKGQVTTPVVDPVLIKPKDGEFASSGGVEGTPEIPVAQGDMDNLDTPIPKPSRDDLGQVKNIDESYDKVKDEKFDAAQGNGTKEIGDIQGKLSEGALATAATQELDKRATVGYHLDNLYANLEAGKPIPAWANRGVQKAAAMMAARGMTGGGSMAGAAVMQAIMESGIAIASADAQAYGRIQLQNLNNEQATALQNAATIAGMDVQNLNARMTAAVNNARNFLEMDIANLTSEQQARTLTYQSKINALFTDTAAENTRRQINAKTEAQVEEFYAELGTQVDASNRNRNAAMEQFNVSEANAMAQYSQTLADSREKFNANMAFAVDQSNVQWRRQVNNGNTAIQNETNRVNAQMVYGASQQAMNFLWQKYRDNASFNFQKIENAFGREHAFGLMAMEFAQNQQLLSEKERASFMKLVGQFISGWD